MNTQLSIIERDKKTIPFLRWAGGKSWLLDTIKQILPSRFNNYHEPFLGGASIFLGLDIHKNAYLSDINKDLILAYKQVRDNVDLVIKELKTYDNTEEFYYELRQKKLKLDHKRAAQLIFLNRTCFNGVYRVNQEGNFNVPYGNKRYKLLFDYSNLRLVSNKLQKVNLNGEDFYSSLKRIKKGDLVFLDPPYTMAHEHNGFIKYNEKLFTWKDQTRLLDYINELKKRQAYFIMTNAAHSETKRLFASIGNIMIVERHSTISSKSAYRKKIHECIFTNCINKYGSSLKSNF